MNEEMEMTLDGRLTRIADEIEQLEARTLRPSVEELPAHWRGESGERMLSALEELENELKTVQAELRQWKDRP